MRPIKLKIKNVNSFLEEQVADFEMLGGDNIFCITGPVGSGKTTVLDCIILALYGSSGRGNIAEIINIAETKAEIEYTFSENDDRYTVKRIFNKKGASKAELFLKGVMVCDGVDPVNDYLLDLIGISVEDFTQVIILEQGKFANFLKATAAKRNKTVAQLFKLDRFNDLGTRFNSLKTALENRIENDDIRLLNYEGVSKESIAEFRKNKQEFDLQLGALNKELAEGNKTKIELARKHASFKQGHLLEVELKGFNEQIKPLNDKEILLKKNIADFASKKQEKKDSELRLAECEKFLNETEKNLQASSEIAKLEAERNELLQSYKRLDDELKTHEQNLLKKEKERAEYMSYILHYESELKLKRKEKEKSIESEKNLNEELARAREENAALVVRKTLKGGDACPVCGGVFLARDSGEALEIEGIENRLRICEQLVKKLEREIAEIEGVLAQFAQDDYVGAKIDMPPPSKKISEIANLARAAKSEAMKCASYIAVATEKISSVVESGKLKKTVIDEKRAALGFSDFKLEREARLAEKMSIEKFINEYERAEKEINITTLALEKERASIAENIARLQKERAECESEFDEDSAKSLDDRLQLVSSKINSIHSSMGVIDTFLASAEEKLLLKTNIEKKQGKTKKTLDIAERLAKMFKGGKFADFVSRDFIMRFTKRASELLFSLSNGRFSLSFSDEESEFLVTDYLAAGLTRKTKTLSGGETFLASVAVAAAISQLISNFTRNDFFFLDEGFGTLDTKSVGMVLSALKTLSKDVLVGLVSHRSDLTEQIFMQLNVEPATETSGSKLKII